MASSLCSSKKFLAHFLQRLDHYSDFYSDKASFLTRKRSAIPFQFQRLAWWLIAITTGQFLFFLCSRKLPKVAEKLIFKPLYKHLESNGLLANRQYAYRKQLGTCDALLDLTCHMQDDLDKGYESRIVQIDFSSAFDLVNTLTFLRPPKLSAYYRLDVKTSTEKRVSKYSRNNIYSVRCRCC